MWFASFGLYLVDEFNSCISLTDEFEPADDEDRQKKLWRRMGALLSFPVPVVGHPVPLTSPFMEVPLRFSLFPIMASTFSPGGLEALDL